MTPLTYVSIGKRCQAVQTGNATILWAAHFAGIQKEYLHIEKMANLNKLPPHGFTLICFPVKVRAASAGWVRPVAIVEE